MGVKRIALGLVIALLLAGCGSDTPAASDDDDRFGEWVLVDGTLDGAAFPLVAGRQVTFSLSFDGSFSGRAACNGYGGRGELRDASFVVGEWFITEMGCEPEVMASEQAFMTVLQRSLQLRVDSGQLAMTGPGVDLRFDAVPPIPTADLVGTTWQLHTLIDGPAASSIVADAELRFDADGTFRATTGCRELTGEYLVVNGDELAIIQMTATGACPDEVREQDRFVVAVLEAPRVVIVEDQLRLASDGRGLGYRALSR